MMMNDPWDALLNQRGGGSIDMSRGFSSLGSLPGLDWMPNPAAEHGVDVRSKLPWNAADPYTYFRWYESVLFERAREEDRRLFLGMPGKPRILLADKGSEIPFDWLVNQGLSAGTRTVVNGVEYELVVDESGFKVWRKVNQSLQSSESTRNPLDPTGPTEPTPTTTSPRPPSLSDLVYAAFTPPPTSPTLGTTPLIPPIGGSPGWAPPPTGRPQPSNGSLGESKLAPAPPTTVPPFQTTSEIIITGKPPFDWKVSDPAVLEAIEGRAHLQWGDVKQFVKGGYNGLVNTLPILAGPLFGPIVAEAHLPHTDIDPRYGGTALVGEQLFENLALEGAAELPALGRLLGSALKSERVVSAVKAPAFWALGAGGLGGGLAKAGRIEIEFSALAPELKRAVPPATFPSLPLQAESSVLEGTSPHFKGVVGEERTVAGILEQGGVPIGEHVTFVGPTGQRTTIDIVWVDSEGFLRATETKFGEYAGLTKPQRIVFPQGGHLTLTPVGERAAEAGLPPGQPVGIHVDIQRWLF